MSPATQAQTVTINSTTVTCTPGTIQMQMAQTTGNIQIICTVASGGGGSPSPFACTATATPAVILADSAATSTISVACVNGTAASWAWTNTNAAPGTLNLTASQFVVGPFSGAGSFSFPVVVTGGSTTPATAASSALLTVNAVSTGGGGGTGSCTTVRSSFGGYNSNDIPTIASGSSVSYTLPAYTDPGKIVQIQAVNNGNDGYTNPNWTVQFAISSCAGDFNPASAACTAVGTPQNGALTLTAITSTVAGGGCTLLTGQQYYVSARFINSDLVTPSCPSGKSCSLIINYHSTSPQH
jgi:hypothetical protein